MQVQSINKNQNKPNFNARLNITGGTLLSKKPKSLLPKNALKRLETKAKLIGTDKDTINIGISEYPITEPAPNLLLNAFYVPTYNIKEIKTKVSLSSVINGKISTDTPAEEFISGNKKERKISTYKTIWKYIDNLKEKI